MLHSTRGIVFQHFKYSESSIIVKIFTEELGLQTYIVKGVRSKRSKNKLALFQPLNLLDLVVYHKENKSIHHLKEVRVALSYQSIPVDVTKRSILFFLNELLYKSIREESQNKALFEWLFQSLTWLDLSEGMVANFHLAFAFQLSRFLGFYPKKEIGITPSIFDLEEGQFVRNTPEHPHFISGKLAGLLDQIRDSSFEASKGLQMSVVERRKMLDALMVYYRLHLPGFGEMKSLEVLKSLVT